MTPLEKMVIALTLANVNFEHDIDNGNHVLYVYDADAVPGDEELCCFTYDANGQPKNK